jgi:hypothetical protein
MQKSGSANPAQRPRTTRTTVVAVVAADELAEVEELLLVVDAIGRVLRNKGVGCASVAVVVVAVAVEVVVEVVLVLVVVEVGIVGMVAHSPSSNSFAFVLAPRIHVPKTLPDLSALLHPQGPAQSRPQRMVRQAPSAPVVATKEVVAVAGTVEGRVSRGAGVLS